MAPVINNLSSGKDQGSCPRPREHHAPGNRDFPSCVGIESKVAFPLDSMEPNAFESVNAVLALALKRVSYNDTLLRSNCFQSELEKAFVPLVRRAPMRN